MARISAGLSANEFTANWHVYPTELVLFLALLEGTKGGGVDRGGPGCQKKGAFTGGVHTVG